MPVIRAEKTEVINEVTDKLKKSSITIFLDCNGMTVGEVNTLRSGLRKKNAQVRVVKNTLARIATKNLNLSLDKVLCGPTSIVFGSGDAIEPTKYVVDLSKDITKLSIKGGVMDGRVLGAKELTALSNLPSRLELIAKLVGGIKAPITKFVLQTAAPLRKLLYVLEAIRQQKEQSTNKEVS